MIEASLRPDWGRAGPRSSIITAIGWRAAAAGVTSSPVRGAGTITGGPRLADGDGDADGRSLADGPTDALADGLALGPLSVAPLGVGVVGEQPPARTDRTGDRQADPPTSACSVRSRAGE